MEFSRATNLPPQESTDGNLDLMPYNYELTYRPGKDAANPADFISRRPDKSTPFPDNVAEVIYEQRERVFHRDIQTRENNGENTSAQRECFCPLLSSVWISR